MQIDLATLPSKTPKQLMLLWKDLSDRGDPPHFKQALLRGIGWHIQANAHGGLDAETRRLLKAASRSAPDPTPKAGKPRHRTNTKKCTRAKLAEGSTLVRT